MMSRVVFWDVLPCKIIVDSSLMMEAVRTSETSVDNYFTRRLFTCLVVFVVYLTTLFQ
jgi:hypothetical protein